MASPFDTVPTRELVDLIEAYPLAWVVSHGGGGFGATPLPLMAETSATGEPVRLIGHFARSNPQVAAIERAPRALFLFLGPHGYISPSWVSNRAWAPTWNYAVIRIEADVRFVPERTDQVLENLVARMERGRSAAWSPCEMGERYERLRRGVVPFEAEVVSVRPRFKLGQDERPETYAEILAHLGDPELEAWMRRANATHG
jgi:transcriptional regulator